MKLSLFVALVAAGSASAFVPHQQAFVRPALRMSDEEAAEVAEPTPTPSVSKENAMVPIKEETVEFTAGILGGVAGFVVGGPVVGAVGAAAANYLSKTEGEPSEVVSAASKSAIQIYNYLLGLDNKYSLLTSAKSSLEGALEKLKSQGNVDQAAVKKVEDALASTKSKITEINDEYDLVGGGVTVLGIVGDLVEKAVKKASELNEEYQLSDKALGALNSAVDKAKDASKKA